MTANICTEHIKGKYGIRNCIFLQFFKLFSYLLNVTYLGKKSAIAFAQAEFCFIYLKQKYATETNFLLENHQKQVF